MQNTFPEIKPEQSLELLKELHLLTRDGKLNQDARRKIKQIYHLYHFIEPILGKIFEKNQDPHLVDMGSGKSYLGFILYDLFLKKKESGELWGIETREELNQKSHDLSIKLKFNRMRFINSTIEEAIKEKSLPEKFDLVTALHACDTATDAAIDFALNKRAPYLVLIPCCQAELASYLRKIKGPTLSKNILTEVYRHPLHTREFGSHLTNVLRCLKLESHGYQVTVTEFTGWEHSLKNELIIAEYKNLPKNYPEQRLQEVIKEFDLQDFDRYKTSITSQL